MIEGPAGSGKSVVTLKMGLAALELGVVPLVARSGLVSNELWQNAPDDGSILERFLRISASSTQLDLMSSATADGHRSMLIIDGLNEAALPASTADQILREAAERFNIVRVSSRPRLTRGYPDAYETAVALPLSTQLISTLSGAEDDEQLISLQRLPFFLDVFMEGGDLRTRYHAIESYVISCILQTPPQVLLREKNLHNSQLLKELRAPIDAMSEAAFFVYQENGSSTFAPPPEDDSNGEGDSLLGLLTSAFGSLEDLLETGLIVRSGSDAVDEGQLQFRHQLIHCLLYTSPSPRDATLSRMPSSA